MSIEKIISDFASRAAETQPFILVQNALSLDGRISEEDMLAPMTLAECYAVECIISKRCCFSVNGNISLVFRPHGKLCILPREDFEVNSEFFTLLGHVEFSSSELCKYKSLKDLQWSELENERAAILNHLLPHGIEGVCRELFSLSQHMAPLVYYVGEFCISNFYDIGRSEFKLEYTLEEVLKAVIEQRENSPIEFLIAVFCMHLLLSSGGYTRLEELNSTQLSRAAIDKYFDNKYEEYQKICGTSAGVDHGSSFALLSLEEKAVWLADMRKTIQLTPNRFTREISAVILRKKEKILSIPPVDASASLASLNPSKHTMGLLRDWLQLSDPSGWDVLSTSFEKLIGRLVVSQEGFFSSPLESLIDYVVAEAVRNTRSDFGMTRGTRDFLKFSHLLNQGRADLACAWGQSEYFCHVVPNQKMKVEHSPKKLSMFINAISGRMRFNTWHYAPSYFNVENIPAGRDWFHAPRMADIADNSDQHHTGHVHAAVRYSIRSPSPICIGEIVLPGFIDLRLMRQSGDPYGSEDLIKAIAYTESLQFIYQCLMNYVLNKNESFVFSFGNKEWIQRVYAPQQLEVAVAID